MEGRARLCVLACVVIALGGCAGVEPDPLPRADASPGGPRGSDRLSPSPSPSASASASAGALAPTSDDVGAPLAITVAADGPPGSLAGLLDAAAVVEYPLTPRGSGLVVVTRTGTAAVGPLRTAAAGDAATAAVFAADLLTTTASTAIVDAVRSVGRRVIEEPDPDGSVVRDPARRAPHNAYARPGLARRRSTRPEDRDGTLWRETSGAPAGGRPAHVAGVTVTPDVRVSWTWDPALGRWLRTARGRPERLADGRRVAAATVVVLEVSGARGGLGALSGVGPAAVLRRGRRYAARWTRDAAAAAPSLQSRGGAALPVEGPVWTVVCATPCAQRIAPLARRPRDGAR